MDNDDIKDSGKVSRWERLLKWLSPSKLFRLITNSAIFGLILTLAIFVYEQYKSSESQKEIVDNLVYVQKSLSTRYLGLFPDYLNHINEILDDAQPRDTVVIFEDVLYYGFESKPADFKKMHKRLISMAYAGTKVSIAYYNPNGRVFKRMIIDQYIATDISAEMDMVRRANFNRQDRGNRISMKELKAKDSILCDQYFDKTREASPEAFKLSVDKKRKPLANLAAAETGLDIELEKLYIKIDSIKSYWLAEDYDELCIHDFENMYRDISALLAEDFARRGIELIPIDENLSVGCWLVADKAIMAFPSKYATDEIGFYSQDPAFSRYIMTMLNGFRGNYSKIDTQASTD